MEPGGSVWGWGRLLGLEPGQPRAGRPDAGKGTRWGSPRPLLSPLGQSARKAFPDCPEHGKGPRTQPSFQGFPALCLAPRSWEAWGGGRGSEAEGRPQPAAASYPDSRWGLPVHPRRTPKARRQQDAAPGRLFLCTPSSLSPSPLPTAPHCRPPDARSSPSPALPPTAAEQIPWISCLWPPEHPLPAPPQQRTWGGCCAAAQCAGLGTRVGAVGFLEAGPASCQYCGSPDPTSSPLSWDDSRKQPPRPGLGVLPGSSERPGRREREGLSQG